MARSLWPGLILPSTLLTLCLIAVSSFAVQIPVERRAFRGSYFLSPQSGTRYTFSSSQTGASETINNIQDIRYTTNITINGVHVQVVLDTGSTDLWVIPPGGIGRFNDTNIPLSLAYGDGSYGTYGTIGVSPFVFGSYSIEKQAFLNALNTSVQLLDELNIHGVMGLSFDLSTASPINEKIKELHGPDATWGQSILKNIFQSHPEQPNFIAIDLSRTDDMEDTKGGSFDIGEYATAYAAVANSPKLPQYPVGGDRWTTLLGGIFVGGKAIEVFSVIPGVPPGSAQALFDTGDPTGIFPTAIADAIYSLIPGAELYQGSDGKTWFVPCNATTIVEIVFGGVKYPIHPLDLTTLSDPILLDGKEYTACTATFNGIDNWGGSDFEVSLGDSFLRNVYAVFDFGDTLPDGTTDKPYMQLLSQVDPAKAIADVGTIRAKTLENRPPPIDPATLIQLLGLNGSAASTSTSKTTGVGNTSEDEVPIASQSDHTITFDESTLRKYGIIVMALLAGNILIGLILLVFGVFTWIRRGSSRKMAMRQSAPAYVPIKSLENDEGYGQTYNKPYA